jgi:phosphatidylglycerol lysyltransferase
MAHAAEQEECQLKVLMATQDSELLRARELVMAHGWNSTSYQILNPGIEYWFAPRMATVAGYIRQRDTLVVAGAPIGPRDTLPQAIEMFEQQGRQQGYRVCYVCAQARLQNMLAPLGNHSTVVLGAQPVWNPQRWTRIAETQAPLRRQLNRARNKGVTVELTSPELARDDVSINQVLSEWLTTRPLPPLHFLTEPMALRGEVSDRIVLVARVRNASVAFLVASPVPARQGYLIEQVARSPQAPNGTVELLIDSAMRSFADRGVSFATLGLVLLTSHTDREIVNNPWWLRTVMRMARKYANRFYNFRGLEHFRAKMSPEAWEPIYAISNERRFSLRSLHAVVEAFSGVPVWRFALLASIRLARRDIRKHALFPRPWRSIHFRERMR